MHRLYVQKCARTLQHYVQASTKLSHACLCSRNGKIYRPPFEITLLSWLRALPKSLTWTVISRWQHSLYLSIVYRVPLKKNHVDKTNTDVRVRYCIYCFAEATTKIQNVFEMGGGGNYLCLSC
jgi:hypothetical protein